MRILIHCSPLGHDRCTGQSSNLEAKNQHGPVKSLGAAFSRVRIARAALRHAGLSPAPATIVLDDGVYAITRKIELNAQSASDITVEAKTPGKAFIDAGVRITGFEKTSIRGNAAYVANVSTLLKHEGIFRQLFVNGERRQVARTAEIKIEGHSEAHMLNGTQVYGVKIQKGRLAELRDPESIDAIVPSLFSANRIPVEQFIAADDLLILQQPLERSRLSSEFLEPFFWLEHVFEELKNPGDWYCDRQAGKLYYLPLAGEDPNSCDVVATTRGYLLEVTGTPEHPVTNLKFSGIGFRYANWDPVYRTAQSDPYVPPTIQFLHSQFSGFWDCTFEHLGHYAVKFGEGAKHCSLIGCTFRDIGAGGVIVDGGSLGSATASWSEGHRITDNEFVALGRVFIASSAILVMQGARNRIAYNKIHDLYYTAISVGWTWGYRPQMTAENRIEHNHVFNLGQGVLSDLAAIYTLGVQPGTTIRHNLIHDVTRRNYGGFGINLDEGSSHIVIEHNVIYNISSQCLHQHFGRENSIRYNIFAYGEEGIISFSRGNSMHWPEKGGVDDGSITNAFSFHDNVLLARGQAMFIGALGDESGSLQRRDFLSDHNVYWDETGAPFFGDGVHGAGGRETMTFVQDFTAWQQHGRDRFGSVQDPKFVDPSRGNFALSNEVPQLERSLPARQLEVGPRSPEARKADEKVPELVSKYGYG